MCEYTANTRAKCADTRKYTANTPDTCILDIRKSAETVGFVSDSDPGVHAPPQGSFFRALATLGTLARATLALGRGRQRHVIRVSAAYLPRITMYQK